MGAASSTRRAPFQPADPQSATIVKGVRLSENVINRMRESQRTRSTPAPPPPSSSHAKAFDPITSVTADPARPSAPLPPEVDESELRRQITEEVRRGVEEERNRTQQELHQWLEREWLRVQKQAYADAEAHVKDEVGRILASERAAAQDGIQQALLRDRLHAEEDRARTQLYVKQLEDKKQRLKKQEAFYREQVRKLEERGAQFYKVSDENHQKAADEVKAKYKRYEVSPVCADLQAQILKCYKENSGRTLLCSGVASLYLQCVDDAKHNKTRTGG